VEAVHWRSDLAVSRRWPAGPGGSALPTYEYVCRSCDAHLEVVQRFDDASLTDCPSCGGTLRKVFGNIGIAFKGSGFYKNDSRSMAKSGNGSSSKGDGAKGGAKDSGAASKDGAATTTKEATPASKEPAGSKSSSGSAPSTAKSA
jgi:putative FmdB family regulatory protein